MSLDVTAFFAEDLLTPVVKLLRHASEDIYQQAGALIDFVQGTCSLFDQVPYLSHCRKITREGVAERLLGRVADDTGESKQILRSLQTLGRTVQTSATTLSRYCARLNVDRRNNTYDNDRLHRVHETMARDDQFTR